MDTADLGRRFQTIEQIFRHHSTTSEVYTKVADVLGHASVVLPNEAEIAVQADAVVHQVNKVLTLESPTLGPTFFYFGLFEQSRGKPALYIAGGSGDDAEACIKNSTLDYFPKERVLSVELLQIVMTRARSENLAEDVADYLVCFAVAALIVERAARLLKLDVPVFVGFDSGDFACVYRARSATTT